MSNYFISEQTLTDIMDGVRRVTNSTGSLTIQDAISKLNSHICQSSSSGALPTTCSVTLNLLSSSTAISTCYMTLNNGVNTFMGEDYDSKVSIDVLKDSLLFIGCSGAEPYDTNSVSIEPVYYMISRDAFAFMAYHITSDITISIESTNLMSLDI